MQESRVLLGTVAVTIYEPAAPSERLRSARSGSSPRGPVRVRMGNGNSHRRGEA